MVATTSYKWLEGAVVTIPVLDVSDVCRVVGVQGGLQARDDVYALLAERVSRECTWEEKENTMYNVQG